MLYKIMLFICLCKKYSNLYSRKIRIIIRTIMNKRSQDLSTLTT